MPAAASVGTASQRGGRSAVSVVMPFHGPEHERLLALSRLSRIRLGEGDELILSENRAMGPPPPRGPAPADVRVVAASEELSSYYARNVGADTAAGEWILFIDADCVPDPAIIDRYFAARLADRVGVVAGGVRPALQQRSLAARYARSRGHIDETWHIRGRPLPAGVTANLLVRRAAWESLGGFHEGVRSGADVEFCWRVQEAGWSFAHRPEAFVEHLHPDGLSAILRKTRRHAAGRLWVNRRYSGAYERPRPARQLVRSLGGAALFAARGEWERSVFKLIDATWHGADAAGYALGDNRAPRPLSPAEPAAPGRKVLFMTDAAPARSETFVQGEAEALASLGVAVRMEASARPARSDRARARSLPLDYMEDDPPREKAAAMVWLATRHPMRVLRDLSGRRRMPGEQAWPLTALAPAARRLASGGEAHVHVHFGAAAALHGLRISRLAGVPFSIAWHGYDVYQKPVSVPEKLRAAALSTAACEYMRRDLVAIGGEDLADRIAVVPMGVDPEVFRRRSAPPDQRRVAAIGRLVEKKGFVHLVRAAAELRDRGAGVELRIYGEGPLREDLEREIERLGLAATARIEPLWGAEAVREALERTDVLAVPSVVASDGDRDSMPVVAKEALAMELPVIASDEVGLPELIEDGWGRLVTPGDEHALAQAIEEVLALPASRRTAMGAAGRQVVLDRFTVEREARRLAQLIGV